MINAIGTICSYLFVTKREGEDVYDMHRLVHLAMRILLNRNRQGVMPMPPFFHLQVVLLILLLLIFLKSDKLQRF